MWNFGALRFAALVVFVSTATISYAQTGTTPLLPPMPANPTAAQQTSSISTLNGLIKSYTPTAVPAGKKPLGGKQDAGGTSLLTQLKAKGIAVPMVNLFIAQGGTLNVVEGAKVKVGQSQAVAKYNVDTKTITVGTAATDAKHVLKANLAVTTLGNIGHEFWHAYKAQIVDGGYDPDTAKVFANLKTWLVQQKVTHMDGGTPGAQTPFLDINPAYTRFTVDSHTDDFADEYVAGILTDIFSYGPYLGGEHDAPSIYTFFAHYQTDSYTGYFNDNGENYRVDAAPPQELILHLYRLTIGTLVPRAASASPSVTEDQGQPQLQVPNAPGGVAPEHSFYAPNNGGTDLGYAAVPRDQGQSQTNCFGDAACERAQDLSGGGANNNSYRNLPDLCWQVAYRCSAIPQDDRAPSGGDRGDRGGSDRGRRGR